MVKSITYKGFKIVKGEPEYTHNNYSIFKGNPNKPNHQYFGGADSIAEAKKKIDEGTLKRLY